MNPKLTDEAVARLPLADARSELREEIVSRGAGGGAGRGAGWSAYGGTRRWLAPVAAAVVVAAIAVSTWGYSQRDAATGGAVAGQRSDEPSAGASSSAAAATTRATPSGRSSAAPLPSSPSGYRAVLDAPGWTAVSTEEDAPFGEVDYAKGAERFDITWYGADSYASYVGDREDIVTPPAPGDPVEVLGAAGQRWAYGPQDHTVIREVRNGHWMELRGSGMSLEEYAGLLDRLRLVDVDQFEASLPERFVTAGHRSEAVLRMVRGIDEAMGPARGAFPMGVNPGLSSDESDPYQLGAYVAGQVACSWLSQYVAARASGDQAAVADAVEAMATSRRWPVLKQMVARGDYPAEVWRYADRIAAGKSPDGYRRAMGCTTTR